MAEENNITKSFLSISSPGVHLVPGDDELGRRVCRDCNSVASDAKRRHPDRIGFWASLPLPDVDGSLNELSYALDELKADGIAVETNKHGFYLGHPSYEPVWAELNRRRCIVFVHPTSGCVMTPGGGDGSEVRCNSATPLSQYPNPIFEFYFDTARAVINLFYTGVISRYPNITYIVSHAGGCLPPLIDRFALFGQGIPGIGVDRSVSPAFVKERLQSQFYFDMAGPTWPNQVSQLLSFVGKDRLLYGSDYPFTAAQYVDVFAEIMAQHMPAVLTTVQERQMAYSKNAEKLLGDKTISGSAESEA